MLADLLTSQVFAFLLIFTRVGAAFMIMPGFGEPYVNTRARLTMAVMVTFVLTPLLSNRLPAMPEQATHLVFLLAAEALVGFFIGMIGRTIMMAMDVAGQIMAFQTGLSNAFAFNPSLAQQGSLIGAFLTVTAAALIFASNTHHYLLIGLFESYNSFTLGISPLGRDFADAFMRAVSESFYIGAQVAAPLILVGLVFYVALGVIGRLIPQIQVFFVALPVQIVVGLIVLMITLSGSMIWFLSRFQDIWQELLS